MVGMEKAMQNQVELELPWPPSTNKIWRRMGRKTVLAPEARKYRANVQAAIGLRPKKLVGPLMALITLYPPNAQRSDVDNRQKAIFDAIQKAGLIEDDVQIRLFAAAWGKQRKLGAVHLVLRQVQLGEVVSLPEIEVH